MLAPFIGGLLFTWGALVTPAHAQDFPKQPVRILVGFTPGASTDIFARLLASEMQQGWGQPVVVESKPGANGIIATTELANAKPDGYTLMLTISSHVTNALYYKDLPYDIENDFTPVTLTMRTPWLLIAAPSFPANTVPEVIAMAKEKPGEIYFGSAGEGSTPYLVMEMMNLMAGTKMTHVPYKGSSRAIVDLVGGQISLLFSTVPLAQPFLANNRVKPIGISSPKRAEMLPDVPTIDESGVRGFEADIWFGIIGPKNIPADVTNKIQAEVVRALKTPKVMEALKAQSAELIGSTPEEFARFLEADYAKWKKTFREANITTQ